MYFNFAIILGHPFRSWNWSSRKRTLWSTCTSSSVLKVWSWTGASTVGWPSRNHGAKPEHRRKHLSTGVRIKVHTVKDRDAKLLVRTFVDTFVLHCPALNPTVSVRNEALCGADMSSGLKVTPEALTLPLPPPVELPQVCVVFIHLLVWPEGALPSPPHLSSLRLVSTWMCL